MGKEHSILNESVLQPCEIKGNVAGSHESASIYDIPLDARYKLIPFYGAADGTNLTHGFNDPDILKRIITIKSLRVIPYASADTVDLFMTDGATTFKETIPSGARLDRIFDVYTNYTDVRLILNGALISVFANVPGGGHYPLDLWIDNVFYRLNQALVSIDVQVNGTYFDDIEAQTTRHPNVKVLIECYLQ